MCCSLSARRDNGAEGVPALLADRPRGDQRSRGNLPHIKGLLYFTRVSVGSHVKLVCRRSKAPNFGEALMSVATLCDRDEEEGLRPTCAVPFYQTVCEHPATQKGEVDGAMRLPWLNLLVTITLPAALAQGQKIAASQGTQAPAACAACHEEAKSQLATSMGHALETAQESKVLASHVLLTFKRGDYSYRIERRGNQSLYSVSDSTQTLTLPIRWAMGASSAIGQTFILEKDGQFYESRVSYFSELGGLDLTLGARNSEPADILEAAGRRMSHSDDVDCFGCHATNATHAGELTLDTMTPGVQCERCHGPAEKHVAALAQGKPEVAAMRHLGSLSTEEVSNFCGQCHRTWEQVVMRGRFDINNIRFQPYRLTESKCYDTDDPRISCLACHDPHREVDATSAEYDSKCQACHAGGKAGARTCRVSTKNCTSCHMPKLELPGAHHKFTDHRIRIVRGNEAFPG